MVTLLAVAVVSFLPWTRNAQWAGALVPDVSQRAGNSIVVPASVAATWLAGRLGKTETPAIIEAVAILHSDN